MDNKLISVIVPVYKVEQYLKKCVDSIINQTYKELEIILVDDGSADNCSRICDEYQKKDKRIKVIHKENGGLSSARNAGLDMASGDLISFVDSDDYLELTMLEELKADLDKNGSDISTCNFYYEKRDGKKIALVNSNNSIFISKDKYINIYNEYSPATIHVWNKLYKKNIFDDIRFPNGVIFEDTYILCDILENASKISYINKPLYNYVYRDSSIFHKFNLKHFDNVFSSDRIIESLNYKKYFDLVVKEKNKKLWVIIVNLSKMKANNIKNKEVFNKYYKEALELKKQIKWKDSSKKIKIFKIFGRFYIYFRAFEYKVLYLIRG